MHYADIRAAVLSSPLTNDNLLLTCTPVQEWKGWAKQTSLYTGEYKACLTPLFTGGPNG